MKRCLKPPRTAGKQTQAADRTVCAPKGIIEVVFAGNKTQKEDSNGGLVETATERRKEILCVAEMTFKERCFNIGCSPACVRAVKNTHTCSQPDAHKHTVMQSRGPRRGGWGGGLGRMVSQNILSQPCKGRKTRSLINKYFSFVCARFRLRLISS